MSTTDKPTWLLAERFRDVLAIEEAITNFAHDQTGDNATGIVLAVLEQQAATEAAKATGTAGELPTLPEGTWFACDHRDGVQFHPTEDQAKHYAIDGTCATYFSADQMRAYGQACAEAARQPAPVAAQENGGLVRAALIDLIEIEQAATAGEFKQDMTFDFAKQSHYRALFARARAAIAATAAPVVMPPAAWAAESTTGGTMRMLTKISLLESEVDRYVNRADMAQIGCDRVKVPLYRAAPLTDYTVLHEWANAKGVSYNELCAVLRAATNRSQP